jgi:hypothetical protein
LYAATACSRSTGLTLPVTGSVPSSRRNSKMCGSGLQRAATCGRGWRGGEWQRGVARVPVSRTTQRKGRHARRRTLRQSSDTRAACAHAKQTARVGTTYPGHAVGHQTHTGACQRSGNHDAPRLRAESSRPDASREAFRHRRRGWASACFHACVGTADGCSCCGTHLWMA